MKVICTEPGTYFVANMMLNDLSVITQVHGQLVEVIAIIMQPEDNPMNTLGVAGRSSEPHSDEICIEFALEFQDAAADPLYLGLRYQITDCISSTTFNLKSGIAEDIYNAIQQVIAETSTQTCKRP